MIIKQLELISFGQFKYKKLTLDTGMNVIYGNNEAGKTTIHKFIEGILFGFFKPYSKRRIYTEDYEKYFPWNDTEYRGVLKFIYGEEIYRIERNFIKGFDDVKIFDDKTGEDITYLFDYDPVLRLHLPSSVIGFNSVVYNNTVNIKQLESKTDEVLAKEVKDSLINIGRSLDEDISVKNALEDLDKEIKSIGTKGQRKSSPYGRTIDKLDVLYDEREKALKYIHEIKKQEIKLNNLKAQIFTLKKESEYFKKNLENIKKLELKEKYEEALQIINEIDILFKEEKMLKKYSNLNFDDYTYLISLEKQRDGIKTNIGRWNEELKKVNGRLNELMKDLAILKKYDIVNEEEFKNIFESYKEIYRKRMKLEDVQTKINDAKIEYKILDETNITHLMDDIYCYEEIEEKKDTIFNEKQHTEVFFLRTRLQEKTKELKKNKLFISISLLATLISIVLGFKIPLIFILASPIFVLLIYNLYSNNEIKNYLRNLKNKIQDISEKERKKDEELEKLENEMKAILEKHDCKTKLELRRLIDENYEISMDSKNKNKSLRLLKTEKKALIEELYQSEEKLKEFEDVLDVKKEFDLEDVKAIERQYFEFIKKKFNEEELLKEQKHLRERINRTQIKLTEISQQIEDIFIKNSSINIEEFKEGLKKKTKYNNIIKDLENKKILLNKILGNNSLDSLKEKVAKTDGCFEYDYETLERDDLENKIEDVKSKISDKEQNITRVEERIDNLGRNFRPLVEIDEDILRREKKKKDYENKLESLKIARNTIEKISKNIQRDFAPTLNERVSDIIFMITEGKYSEVKISENMNISVVDPKSNTLVDIEELSEGTMDQLYFSTRFGIVDILKKEKIPLILDDCFVQYDINRLENILRFLSKESENRQIILFTCHTREKEILDKLNIKFNYLSL